MARTASRDQGGNGGRGSKWIRPEKRASLYASDGHRCVYCQRDLSEGDPSARTLDHVVPRELGGLNVAQNLVTACLTCNAQPRDMPLGPWLKRYMHGVITLLVNAPSFYDDLVQRASDQERAGARWGMSSIAHDLSVHALNYHLIPDAAVDDLAGRIRAALPARYADWSRAEASAPLTLTYFYDNDFNRYTYGVWCNCERPEDFAAIFLAERNYAQLVAALEIRLRETEAGIGDVASGVVDDMGPLTPTSFEI